MSPSPTLHKKITNTERGNQSDERRSKLSKSINSTETIKAESITKLHKYKIKVKKVFTTLNTKI